MTEDIRHEVNRMLEATDNSAMDSHIQRGGSREGYFGSEIRSLVQDYLIGMRERGSLPLGSVSVDSDVVLNLNTLELNRISTNDRTIGSRDWPLGPDAWFRSYQGILDQVTRLGEPS